MIEVQNVVKTFDGFPALNNLTLTVPKGAVYGLVGPNGAGKSTILRHITGVMQQDSGLVHVDGQPVFENAIVKSRMANIPDEIFHFPQANIREMKKFYQGIYPTFDNDTFEKLRPAFNLNDKTHMRRLSKGMLKQAGFWLALSTHPQYLILDEPVDGLDPVMRRQVWSLILEDVANHGTTVLVSSHNLRELEDVCDHVGIMDHGTMLLERSLEAMQDHVVKIQLVTDNPMPQDLDILHTSQSGRIQTFIVRGTQQEVSDKIAITLPVFFDAVPLSLEEIFIYELGGVDYAVKNIVV